jgi:hypothetical protein
VQRPRPSSEAGIELDGCLTGVAYCALDFFEVAGCEIVPLLQVDALAGRFAGSVGGDGVELAGEPSDKIGELALTPSDLLQLFDQAAALPVGLFEEPTEQEGETARAIARQGLRERRNCRQPLFRRNPPRCEAPNQIGNFAVGTPITQIVQWWATPIRRDCKLWHEPLLTRPIRILCPWRRRMHLYRSDERRNQRCDRQVVFAKHPLLGGAARH